jgi:hypothetical protein
MGHGCHWPKIMTETTENLCLRILQINAMPHKLCYILSSVKHTCTKLFTRIGGCVREKEESSGDESFSDRSAYLDAPWDLKSEFPITQ